MTTTNFADFGWRERKMAAELLNASCEQGFPADFNDDEVTIVMNRCSGNVFFTNADCQVCMMNGDKLETYYTTPYSGYEGFLDELIADFDPDTWNQEVIDFLHDIGGLSEDEYDALEVA